MTDKQEPIFPQGLIFKKPRDGAPEFVKGSISIKVQEMITWLNTFQDEWINLDCKESKSGKYYSQLNTYKLETTTGTLADHNDRSSDGQNVPF